MRAGNSFIARLVQPVYVVEILLFTVAAAIFGLMALRSAIPGRTLGAHEATLAGVLVAAGAVLVTIGEPLRTTEPLAEFVRAGLPCARFTLIVAILPWLALWWMVRRAAPMRGGLSGMLAGAGALSFSCAMMRIACPLDEPFHLLTWHLLPALILTALSASAGAAWLRFRPVRAKLGLAD
jgi:hypothetical protein